MGLLTTVLLIALLLSAWRERTTRPIFPLAVPLLLYLGSASLSLTQAVNPYEGGAKLLLIVTGIALFWAVVNAARTPEVVARLLSLAALSGVLVSLVGISQHWLGGIPGLEELLSPASTFGNKNLAAQFVVLVLPLPFLFLFFHRDFLRRTFWGFCGGVILIYLIYTRSRGSWVGLLGAFAVVFLSLGIARVKKGRSGEPPQLFAFNWRKALILAGVVVFVTTMVVPEYHLVSSGIESVQQEVRSLIQPREYTTGINRARLAWWANTLSMIRDHPMFGVGVGNWHLRYPPYARSIIVDPVFGGGRGGTHPNETHNDYLQILAETGPVGLLAFVWVLLCLGRRGWQGFFASQDRFRSLAILALSVGLLALLSHALVDFPFEQPVPTAFFWILCGCLWTLSSPTKPEDGVSRLKGLVVWTGLALLVALSAGINLARVRADYHFAFAAGYNWAPQDPNRRYSLKEIRVELKEVRAAIARYPFEYDYHLAEGILHLHLSAYREAARANLKALRLHPYYVPAHINLGLAYMGLNEAEKSEAAFRQVLKIWPSVEAYNNLGILYASMGRRADAEREFRAALRVKPADPRARHNLQLLLSEERATSDR